MDIDKLRNLVIDKLFEDGGGTAFAYSAAIAEVNDMTDEEVRSYANLEGLTKED